MSEGNHLLQHILHLRSFNFCHQTFQEVVSDRNMDGVLLETHLGNGTGRVFLTLGIWALVLESLPILILSPILLSYIVLSSVHHEGEVAFGVEAGGVVVLRGREVDRSSFQGAPLLSCCTLAFAHLTRVQLFLENLRWATWNGSCSSNGNILFKCGVHPTLMSGLGGDWRG